METISLKLELMKTTHAKEQIYCKMTELNTGFSNWLLQYDELSKATSKVYKLFLRTNCLRPLSTKPSGK